jgi:hypothetical protein
MSYSLSTLEDVTGRFNSMAHCLAVHSRIFVPLLMALACRDKAGDSANGGRSLPAVFSLGPTSNTNWNVNAGPVMLLSAGNSSDSVSVVLPEATDSTIDLVQDVTPPVSGLVFELFNRGGKVDSTRVLPQKLETDTTRDCSAWPVGKTQSAHPGWRVGFVRGNVRALPLDSIESLPSADSAMLAASLAQTAATLPVSSDPTFRRLPFRVQSAYTFRLDSVEVVVADIVRTLNEEANPRIEHLLVIGERPIGTKGRYAVGYFSRIAGAEETMQATEVLAAVRIGVSKSPAIIVSVESEEGVKLGLIERTGPGQWRSTWKSAYTSC